MTPGGGYCVDPAGDVRVASDLGFVCSALVREMPRDVEGLMLVGGYARGEGGLVEREGFLGPYNDYDLVVVTKKGARGSRSRLRRLGARCTQVVGVDVDFWPIERAALASVPPTLFWLDVSLGGGRLLFGEEGILSEIRKVTPREVPLDEAARLLANRAVGLALSNLEGPHIGRRALRHVHKAVLACGDAILLAASAYEPTVAARAAALSHLAEAPSVGRPLVAAYHEAALFRARPDLWEPPFGASSEDYYHETKSRVAGWHLAFETFRVGAPKDPARYASFPTSIYPGAIDLRWGGAPLCSALAAWRGQAPWRPYVGHPRERLARAAVALAYGSCPASRAAAQRLLGAANRSQLAEKLQGLTHVAG